MNRNALFWGGFLVILGTLLLLDNLDWLPFDVWDVFWPSFLILLGVRILWRQFKVSKTVVKQIDIPIENFQEARINLKHGAGRLAVRANSPAGSLLSGEFGGGVEVDTRSIAAGMEITLSMPSQEMPAFFEPGSLDWSLTLAQQIPLALELETGASESILDLRELNVKTLKVKTGASSMVIDMPAAARMTEAEIESGAASLRIRFPEGVAAQIRSRGGLSSLHIDQRRFPQRDGFYESPDFATAVNRVSLNVQMGVGSVDIE